MSSMVDLRRVFGSGALLASLACTSSAGPPGPSDAAAGASAGASGGAARGGSAAADGGTGQDRAGHEGRLAAYVSLLPPAPPSASDLARRWAGLLDAGAEELHLYHLGLASAQRLRAAAIDRGHVAGFAEQAAAERGAIVVIAHRPDDPSPEPVGVVTVGVEG